MPSPTEPSSTEGRSIFTLSLTMISEHDQQLFVFLFPSGSDIQLEVVQYVSQASWSLGAPHHLDRLSFGRHHIQSRAAVSSATIRGRWWRARLQTSSPSTSSPATTSPATSSETELGSIFKTPCNNDSRTRVQQVMRLFYFSEDREVSTAPNGSLWMALLPILEL